MDATWLSDEQLKGVKNNINYFLQERILERGAVVDIQEIWEYMKYHATGTAANLYGNVHWILVEPNE